MDIVNISLVEVEEFVISKAKSTISSIQMIKNINNSKSIILTANGYKRLSFSFF